MNTIETTPKILNFYNSPIGRKIITGVTGLVLTLFIVFHVTGNLLVIYNPNAYNEFAHVLDRLGILLYLVELILFGAALFHIIIGVSLTIKNHKSRDISYQQNQSAGFPSRQSISSRTMIITGLILLVFLISHLITFKFGQYDSITIHGVTMRDMSKLVIETFHKPAYTITYTGAIIFLGFHLQHGIWSAFQSLSFMNSSWSSLAYRMSSLVAVLITLGFIAIPIVIYFK